MSARWLTFRQLPGGSFADLTSLELDDEQLRELVRASHGAGRMGGRLVHFVVAEPGEASVHYLLDERPTDAPAPLAPSSSAANTAARLRELAAAIERLDIPSTSTATITVTFDDVAPGLAAHLAGQAADAYPDSRQVHSGTRSLASWYGSAAVPPVAIEFLRPGPPEAVYCESCGAVELPDQDFDDLRRPQTAGVATASDHCSEVTP